MPRHSISCVLTLYNCIFVEYNIKAIGKIDAISDEMSQQV